MYYQEPKTMLKPSDGQKHAEKSVKTQVSSRTTHTKIILTNCAAPSRSKYHCVYYSHAAKSGTKIIADSANIGLYRNNM